MNYNAHDMLVKARKHISGGYKTILERWHKDDKYRKSPPDIQWTEEQTTQYDVIALEGRPFQREVGTKNPGKFL